MKSSMQRVYIIYAAVSVRSEVVLTAFTCRNGYKATMPRVFSAVLYDEKDYIANVLLGCKI